MKIAQFIDKTPVATTAANGTAAPTGGAQAQGTAAATTTARAIPDQADPSARIQISKNASALLAGGSSSAEFDTEKVARISKSIEDGTFKVNPGAIADKLMTNAQELLARSQQR